MSRLNPTSSEEIISPSCPKTSLDYALVVLWLRVKDRAAERQRALDHLAAEIAADLVRGSPQALVAASDLADQLAIDAVDVAQLLVFADHLYQRLLGFVA